MKKKKIKMGPRNKAIETNFTVLKASIFIIKMHFHASKIVFWKSKLTLDVVVVDVGVDYEFHDHYYYLHDYDYNYDYDGYYYYY